jgi:hypothetical protein
MGLNRKFTTEIKQTGDSCLMISFNIIFNYYSGLDSDYLFNYFLQVNDGLFSKYNIDKDSLAGLSPECKYVYLYYAVAKASNGNEQFSNEYIANSFTSLIDSYIGDTKMVDIKKEANEIRNILINEEACLSLSCKLTDSQGLLQWHATPIAFDTEFYKVDNGNYILLGHDFMNIKNIFPIIDIGDGILFRKITSKKISSILSFL